LTDTPDPDPASDPADRPVPIPDGPPGRAVFSLEGRSAPALYLIGWVGSLTGLGIIVVSFLAGGGGPAPWLFLAGLMLLSLGLLSATGSQALERSRRTDLSYRGPSPVLSFLAVIAVTLIGTVAVLAPLAALGLDPQSPVATTISLLITMLAYIGIVRLVVVGPGALTWADMGLHATPSAAARDLAIGALVAVPVLVVTLILGGLLARFLQPAPSPLPDVSDSLGLAANLVTAAILAPIGEELFFRGFTTTAWARAIGPGQAIIRGAVFFSIAHVVTLFDVDFATGAQRALFSFVALLPVGIVLGWLFLARRSLYASIGLHSAFNAIQVVVFLGVAAAGR
jgi:membrane protease YdiL (CAAX protease family)